MNKIIFLIFAIFVICNANQIRDEIHGRIQQLAQLNQQVSEARMAFEKFHEVASRNHQEFADQLLNVHNSRRDVRATVECNAAVNTLVNLFVNGSCPGYFITFFNPLSTADAKASAVNNFCSSCAGNFVTAVQSVAIQCNRSDFDISTAKKVGFYPRFLCSKDGNEFCINKLSTVVVPADFTSLNENQLNGLCSPCILKLLIILQQSSTITPVEFYKGIISLKAICVKYNGQYCILNLKKAIDFAITIAQKVQAQKDVTVDEFRKILDIFCSPSYRKITAQFVFVDNANNTVGVLASFSVLGYLCRKNVGKQYCFVVLYDIVKQIILSQGSSNPCVIVGNNSTCPDGCKQLVRNLVTKGGCCWSLIVDALSSSGAGTETTAKTAIINYIKSCDSSLTFPEPCRSVGTANFVITYTNVNTANLNGPSFLAAVVIDFGIAIGGIDSFNLNSSTVVNSKKRANTVEVNLRSVTVPATSAGTLYNVEANQCDNACRLADAQDFSMDIGVSAKSSDVVITSSSSMFAISFVLLSILSIFFF